MFADIKSGVQFGLANNLIIGLNGLPTFETDDLVGNLKIHLFLLVALLE